MPKPTYTTQHQGLPREIWVLGPNLIWAPSWFHLLTLWLRRPRAFSPGKFWNPRSQKWPNPAFWKSVDSYIYVYFTVILFWASFNWGPRKNCPLHSYGRPWQHLQFNYLWQHSLIIKRFQERNIFVLANERQLRSDKPPMSSRGIHPQKIL